MARMLTREDVLRILREHREELIARGARRLGLFGSFASGDSRADSDVDLLVELDRRTFDRYWISSSISKTCWGGTSTWCCATGSSPRSAKESCGA